MSSPLSHPLGSAMRSANRKLAYGSRPPVRIVGEELAVRARTVPPHPDGYVLLSAEVDWRGPLRRASALQQEVLERAREGCERLSQRPDVLEATVFRAVLIGPGEGTRLIKARADTVHHARYDVVVLIRTSSVEAGRTLRADPNYRMMAQEVRQAARYTMEIIARNAIRLGDVDHGPDHVFLFNYFYADEKEKLIPVFERTAGWFQAKTGLKNSVLLQPLEGEATDNGIINHASWPSFRAFLPDLIFRPTFRRFVLANFAANDIAAQPILYRRVWSSSGAPRPIALDPSSRRGKNL